MDRKTWGRCLGSVLQKDWWENSFRHRNYKGLLEEGGELVSSFMKNMSWEMAFMFSVHQLSFWYCRAGWYSDTYFQRLLSIAAHLLGLAARCRALSQTSAQTTSSTGGDWRLPSRSTLFALRAQGYLPLLLPLCQPDRCPVSADASGVGAAGDSRIELNHYVINVWLGGDGGSAGTQTFTVGQAVLVNRSGCTKEAGWIIDRM